MPTVPIKSGNISDSDPRKFVFADVVRRFMDGLQNAPIVAALRSAPVLEATQEQTYDHTPEHAPQQTMDNNPTPKFMP